MEKITHWILNRTQPTRYDGEEKTVLELIGRLINNFNMLMDNIFEVVREEVSKFNYDLAKMSYIEDKVNKAEERNRYQYYIDDYETIQTAIDEMPTGSTLNFDCNKTYKLPSLNVSKGIIFNFNGATLQADTTENVFNILPTGEHVASAKFLNYHFIKGDVTPKNYFYINDGINTYLDGTFSNCYASESIINNYRGYGTIIRGEIRNSRCPRVIWLQAGDYDVQYSYSIDIGADITNADNVGIQIDGGNCKITNVIESCVTGILYTGKKALLPCTITGVHFENNSGWSIKLLDQEGSQATVSVTGCAFSRHLHAIQLGRRITLKTESCYFDGNGVEEYSPNLSSTCKYRGINNTHFKRDTTQFNESNCELNNNVFKNMNDKGWL